MTLPANQIECLSVSTNQRVSSSNHQIENAPKNKTRRSSNQLITDNQLIDLLESVTLNWSFKAIGWIRREKPTHFRSKMKQNDLRGFENLIYSNGHMNALTS